MPKGKSKNRTVDILMRVYLKNGEFQTFLLHIEVQAYFDPFFSRRVFQYFYRISDFLQEPIETLAIMIDEDPNYHSANISSIMSSVKPLASASLPISSIL